MDESGTHISLSMDRLRSRAPRGPRACGKVPKNRGKNLTLIASIQEHPKKARCARTHTHMKLSALEAMEEALSKVSAAAADGAGWFDHGGYQVEVQYL